MCIGNISVNPVNYSVSSYDVGSCMGVIDCTILTAPSFRRFLTSQILPNSLLFFCTILNYYFPVKNDVIKITCTHSIAMMISDGLN